MQVANATTLGWCWALGALLALEAPQVAAQQQPAQQLITASLPSPSISRCSTFRVVVRYDTNPSNLDSTGAAFGLYFDLDQLQFAGVEDVLDFGFVAAQLLGDFGDDDGDPETTARVQTGWSSSLSIWPGEFPVDLYTVVFNTFGNFSGTTLRFAAIEAPLGFTFNPTPLEIPAAMDGLDVDGNGTIDALSDGVLIVRFMFGFRGSALVQNAVGEGCSRCTADQIECYLEPPQEVE